MMRGRNCLRMGVVCLKNGRRSLSGWEKKRCWVLCVRKMIGIGVVVMGGIVGLFMKKRR